jgi:DNA-binding transcriptional MerR regulator
MSTRPGGEQLAISQVSEILGVPVPTIRSWERRYGFPSPGRTEGRHRRYTPDEIERLRSLRDEITRGHPARKAVELVRSGGRGDPRSEFLDRFTEAARMLDADGVRRSLDQATEVMGVERAIADVAMPGMRELGDLWKSGVCDVATEHAATAVVRQWFARSSAATPPPYRPRPLVLATGPTELHTIGLEAFAVLLSRRGWPIRMLGALTPTDALISALMTSRAAGTIITAQRSVGRRGATESIRAADRIPGMNAFYSGNAFATPRSREGVPGTYLGKDMEAAAELVGSVVR